MRNFNSKNAGITTMGVGSVPVGAFYYRMQGPNPGQLPSDYKLERGCPACAAGNKPRPLKPRLQNRPAKTGDTSVTREDLVKRVGINVLKRLGHDPIEWADCNSPIFNSIATSNCSKTGCDLVFGIKQFNEFYSIFSMKPPNYANDGIVEISFKNDDLVGMEEKINALLSSNRGEFVKLPRDVFCITMQHFI